MTKPRALILHAPGTNRDREAAFALELAGARPEIAPLTWLRSHGQAWSEYQILVVPGGFTYADALGAGKLLALDLQMYFAEEVRAFVQESKPVIGICNGFQALVRAGLLPFDCAAGEAAPRDRATLTFNERGRFECRWVTLAATSETCIWTRGLHELLYCPVAHGEGRFQLADESRLGELRASGQIALIYAHPDGRPAQGKYPLNPNGSLGDIAGLTNARGNVLGLMPHPEDHVLPYQHPRWSRGECGESGLDLFRNGVKYASEL